MRTKCLFAILALVSAFFLTAPSWGEVYRVVFDAWTETYVDKSGETAQAMNFLFRDLVDTKGLNGPDAVNSVTVTAPDGTVFDLTGTWSEWQKQYFGRYTATVGGTFKGTVEYGVNSKKTLTASKALPKTLSFLPLPNVTNPLPDGTTTVDSLTPTITWDKVTGAQFYCLELWDQSSNQPVYYFPHNRIHVYRLSFTIPAGVLRPKTNYGVRIEARDSDKNLTKRSRTAWINFKTP